MTLDLTSLEVLWFDAPETVHRHACEQPLSECALCLSWWEEFLQAVSEGRVEVAPRTQQTELPV